jgi:hypothetical protein
MLVDLGQLPIIKENEGEKKLTPRLPSARGENDAHNQTIKGKSFSKNKDQNHPNKQLWLLRIRPAKVGRLQVRHRWCHFEFTNRQCLPMGWSVKDLRILALQGHKADLRPMAQTRKREHRCSNRSYNESRDSIQSMYQHLF